MKYVVIAGAAWLLVGASGGRAEANMKLNLVVRSCDPAGTPWKQTDQDGRTGRLTVKDQLGQVVQTNESVHFSASRCQATFTMSWSDATLLRFLDPDDPMTLTLEACRNGQAACPFTGAVMDDKPVVFQNAPIDSLLPDVFKLQADAVMAEMEARIAADQAQTAALEAEAARATAAEEGLRAALAAEVARATAAEQGLGDGLAAEILRATAAELAEAQARIDADADERQERIDAIADEAQAREEAIAAEALARLQAIADEAGLRAAADDAEAGARAAADDAARAYVDDTFLPMAGGTVGGDLTVDGVLRLRGGLSWDACPAGLDSLEHAFDAVQGTTNRLCASEFKVTPPSVQLDEVLGSYIQPICPMVTQVAQNYVTIGGPAAIQGVNLLLQNLTGLLNDQITPFASSLLGATTGVTNDLIDAINGKIADVNGRLAAHTASINGAIDAYNDLVTRINAALADSTGGVNQSIGALRGYLTAVRTNIDDLVAGVNLAVGDVNSAFAAIDGSLGATSDALNAFNQDPTAINGALAGLTTQVNTLLDTVTAANTTITNRINGAITSINTGFASTMGFINTVSGGLSSLTDDMNAAFDSMLDKSIAGANYVRSELIWWVNDIVVGPQNYTSLRGLNGIMAWIELYVTDPLGLDPPPWVPGVPGSAGLLYSLGDIADSAWSYQITGSPGANLISAPSAIGHVDGGALTIDSLGLPTFDLGLDGASMRGVSHGLGAPSIADVTAPQVTGANLAHVSTAAIPAIPHVALPSIPAWDGFQLEDAVDFEAVTTLMGETMAPICADVEATATGYLQAFVGNVPPLVPDYADAEEVCGSLGAHVCGETEIALLVGDDGTPSDIQYGAGDWTGEGQVMFNQSAVKGFMMSVEWPFLHPDASKLMTFPPGFPFTFTPPMLPTGRFRCCASSAAFE